jgi:N-acetylmuramoyl-L-alanine amidase
MDINEKEINLLARAVYSEARGESIEGQVAVAAVIINRVKSPDFPNTVEEVIFQPWAFTAVHDGQFWLQPDASAYAAARYALSGWDPTKKALFYYNPVRVTSNWIYSRPVIGKIGKHVFAQ